MDPIAKGCGKRLEFAFDDFDSAYSPLAGLIGQDSRIISCANDIAVPPEGGAARARAAFGCRLQSATAFPSSGVVQLGHRSATVKARGVGAMDELPTF